MRYKIAFKVFDEKGDVIIDEMQTWTGELSDFELAGPTGPEAAVRRVEMTSKGLPDDDMETRSAYFVRERLTAAATVICRFIEVNLREYARRKVGGGVS